jgi:hypothetical protein
VTDANIRLFFTLYVLLSETQPRHSSHRSIERQYLVLVRLGPEQLVQFLDLVRVLGGDVVELRPILAEIIEFIRETGRGPGSSRPGSPKAAA